VILLRARYKYNNNKYFCYSYQLKTASYEAYKAHYTTKCNKCTAHRIMKNSANRHHQKHTRLPVNLQFFVQW